MKDFAIDQRSKPIYVVAAIDIGTTYSNFAYAYNSEKSLTATFTAGKNNLPQITSRDWNNSFNSFNFPKTASSVLLQQFDKNKFKCVAFGFEAEEKYIQMQAEANAAKYHLVRNFKMKLYSEVS